MCDEKFKFVFQKQMNLSIFTYIKSISSKNNLILYIKCHGDKQNRKWKNYKSACTY